MSKKPQKREEKLQRRAAQNDFHAIVGRIDALTELHKILCKLSVDGSEDANLELVEGHLLNARSVYAAMLFGALGLQPQVGRPEAVSADSTTTPQPDSQDQRPSSVSE